MEHLSKYSFYKNVTKDFFLDTYDMVAARCFGWTLPGTMMVPFADLANHHNSDTSHEMFNPRLHLQLPSEETKSYYTKYKMMVDFSDFDEN